MLKRAISFIIVVSFLTVSIGEVYPLATSSNFQKGGTWDDASSGQIHDEYQAGQRREGIEGNSDDVLENSARPELMRLVRWIGNFLHQLPAQIKDLLTVFVKFIYNLKWSLKEIDDIPYYKFGRGTSVFRGFLKTCFLILPTIVILGLMTPFAVADNLKPGDAPNPKKDPPALIKGNERAESGEAMAGDDADKGDNDGTDDQATTQVPATRPASAPTSQPESRPTVDDLMDPWSETAAEEDTSPHYLKANILILPKLASRDDAVAYSLEVGSRYKWLSYGLRFDRDVFFAQPGNPDVLSWLKRGEAAVLPGTSPLSRTVYVPLAEYEKLLAQAASGATILHRITLNLGIKDRPDILEGKAGLFLEGGVIPGIDAPVAEFDQGLLPYGCIVGGGPFFNLTFNGLMDSRGGKEPGSFIAGMRTGLCYDPGPSRGLGILYQYGGREAYAQERGSFLEYMMQLRYGVVPEYPFSVRLLAGLILDGEQFARVFARTGPQHETLDLDGINQEIAWQMAYAGLPFNYEAGVNYGTKRQGTVTVDFPFLYVPVHAGLTIYIDRLGAGKHFRNVHVNISGGLDIVVAGKATTVLKEQQGNNLSERVLAENWIEHWSLDGKVFFREVIRAGFMGRVLLPHMLVTSVDIGGSYGGVHDHDWGWSHSFDMRWIFNFGSQVPVLGGGSLEFYGRYLGNNMGNAPWYNVHPVGVFNDGTGKHHSGILGIKLVRFPGKAEGPEEAKAVREFSLDLPSFTVREIEAIDTIGDFQRDTIDYIFKGAINKLRERVTDFNLDEFLGKCTFILEQSQRFGAIAITPQGPVVRLNTLLFLSGRVVQAYNARDREQGALLLEKYIYLASKVLEHEISSHAKAHERVTQDVKRIDSIASALGITEEQDVTAFKNILEEALAMVIDNRLQTAEADGWISALAELEAQDLGETECYSTLLRRIRNEQLTGENLVRAIAEFLAETQDPEFSEFSQRHNIRAIIDNQDVMSLILGDAV